MFRRIVVLLFLVLAACGSPALTAPTATAQPAALSLPTQPPVGATILPSDLGKPGATAAPQGPQSPTDVANVQATAAPTDGPPSTPAAVGFDFALRPQFAQ